MRWESTEKEKACDLLRTTLVEEGHEGRAHKVTALSAQAFIIISFSFSIMDSAPISQDVSKMETDELSP